MPTTALKNQQFRLAARPVGLPKRSDWERTTEDVREQAEGLAASELGEEACGLVDRGTDTIRTVSHTTYGG